VGLWTATSLGAGGVPGASPVRPPPCKFVTVSERDLGAALAAAVRTVERALAKKMQTAGGEPAAPHLERLRAELLVMQHRGVVDPDKLRHMIRGVATWAPEDDLSLLASLGGIARARGGADAAAQGGAP
jgi:hypothetical protein